MILAMETKRPSNPREAYLVADMDFRRIHDPPPPLAISCPKCPISVYIYVAFLKVNGIDVWGQIILF